MIEAFYKSEAYWTAVKALAVIVMIASAWELLRLHGIVLDMTMLQEILYAALVGVAARVIVELSPRPSFPTARETVGRSDIIEAAESAIAAAEGAIVAAKSAYSPKEYPSSAPAPYAPEVYPEEPSDDGPPRRRR